MDKDVEEFNKLLSEYGIDGRKHNSDSSSYDDDVLVDKMEKINKKVDNNKKNNKIINKDLMILKSKLRHLEKNKCNKKGRYILKEEVRFNDDMLLKFDVIHDTNEITLVTGKVRGFYVSTETGFLKMPGLKLNKYNVTGTIQIYDFNHNLMHDGIVKDIIDDGEYYKTTKKLCYFMSNKEKLPLLIMFDALIIIKIFYY